MRNMQSILGISEHLTTMDRFGSFIERSIDLVLRGHSSKEALEGLSYCEGSMREVNREGDRGRFFE